MTMTIEKIILRSFGCIMSMPFNLGLIIVTGLIWAPVTFLSYYNSNFDLPSTLISYITFFSGGCLILANLMPENELQGQYCSLAVVTFISSIITLVVVKSVMLAWIGHMILLPINIFYLMLLVKNIWQERLQLNN